LEQRRDLYLIYKEAVNNLLKYANCTFVTIEMKLNNNIFTLTITDNGVGFDTKIETLRNGLRNMKTRALKLKGRLEINSEINKGTIIRLQMAIN
jgi:signal transduction histidine kinase